MRILQVSAHFPPDFVSGGTLQPQRIARGLRAAGHDVAVLAGNLDPERPPLSTWDEIDPTGLPVRWVSIHPFIWWDDERNYDNPPVTSLAIRSIAEWRPDVVHCHSLQTLGAGIIDAAAAHGVPVVVTMHDFWWFCARQFLVDTESRPCSLVVAASDCPCEAGRPFLDQRTRRLRAALELVDQILVPSSAAARVLVANGVDERRLAVDENGVPHPSVDRVRQPPAADRPDDPRVTVRYTGGSNPMKGADVLLEALRRAGPLRRVRVVAHDMDDALARNGLEASQVPAELAPRYAPEQLEDLFAGTDVLLLPSVMRETYSIVTREALVRGVPVIATDSLGPEEVVRDGHNGRIIPSADPGALADALRGVDDDPAVVGRWRSGAGEVRLRPIEDQVAGLTERYEALVGATGSTSHRGGRHHAVLFIVGIQGAPLRYRAQLPAEAIGLLGARSTVRHYRDPDLADVAAGATHIVVYRVPATPHVLDLIAERRAAGVPVAFDVDDLIFDPDIAAEIPALQLLPPDEAALWLEGVRRYRTTMEACDAYIGSTARLVHHAESVVGMPGFLFENGIGQVLGASSDRALRRERSPGPLRVGYFSGTTTHDDDWRSVAPAVLSVLDRHPEVELWLGGHLQVDDGVVTALGSRLRRIPFTTWHELPELLRDLDVNLAPLSPGGRFNDAKSAIKWLEAALCETPTIASRTEPFERAVDHGTTGVLACDPAEWEEAIDALLDDPALRARMGRMAKRAALLSLSPPLQARRYLDVLDDVSEAHRLHRGPTPSWRPEVRDEQPEAARVPLDAYPPEGTTRRRASARDGASSERRVARVVERLGESLRADGVAVTGHRVAGAVGRRVRSRLRSGRR
jgi:glycosyltransferase involved in cell wall biosynthesis